MPAAGLHPLSAFVQPWFMGGTPDLRQLNAMARERGLVTGGGVALRFAEPPGGAEAYEERAYLTLMAARATRR